MNWHGRAIEIDELQQFLEGGAACRHHLWKERDAIAAMGETEREAYLTAEIKKVVDGFRNLSDKQLFEIAKQPTLRMPE
jgi:hypothetical protein